MRYVIKYRGALFVHYMRGNLTFSTNIKHAYKFKNRMEAKDCILGCKVSKAFTPDLQRKLRVVEDNSIV